MLDKHSYSFNKIFPNQKEGAGHFFKIDFNSHSIIIDGEYGRGSEGKFKDLLNNKFESIQTFHLQKDPQFYILNLHQIVF